MTQTKAADVFVPEVYGDMVQAEFVGQSKVLNSGAVVTDDRLVGNPGDTITTPKWDTLGELDDLTEGVPMVPEKLGTTDSTTTIKEAGKAVEITDKAELVGQGSAAQEARRQFGILAARKVDADLITAAQVTGAYTHATASGAGLTWAGLLGAIGKFGDEWEPSDFAGLFVRPEQWGQIAALPEFIDAGKLGAQTVLTTGQLGLFGGLPVLMTSRLAANKVLLLKKNSLWVAYKRRPIIEEDRDILARTDVITTNVHYAAKRLNDKGVCTITVTA